MNATTKKITIIIFKNPNNSVSKSMSLEVTSSNWSWCGWTKLTIALVINDSVCECVWCNSWERFAKLTKPQHLSHQLDLSGMEKMKAHFCIVTKCKITQNNTEYIVLLQLLY